MPAQSLPSMSTRIKRAHARRRGVLITFEGIEGSGKTTQLAKLATRLREQLFQVVETREPGGTPLAEQIRGLMLNIPRTETGHTPKPDHEFIAPESEAALVFAARSQHVIHVIEPAIADGAIILCDRFSDSTLAYQGYARGLDMRTLILFNRLATRGVLPALTLLFDLPVDTGLAGAADRIPSKIDWIGRHTLFTPRSDKDFWISQSGIIVGSKSSRQPAVQTTSL